jgi:DNA-binding CsgD family transcriptional regulator
MVDVDLLEGIHLTETGGDSMNLGIHDLQQVTIQGTAANRAKAYHQLAQTYLKDGRSNLAEVMLDSLYTLLDKSDSPIYIHVDYKPILNHYLNTYNQRKAEAYTRLMLQEQQTLRKRSLNYNLVESIVDLQTGKRLQELKILQLKRANERLWLLIIIALSAITIAVTVTLLLYQRKRHIKQMRHADENIASMVQKLKQLNQEKESITQKVNEFLNNKDKRHELETLTPFILKEDGELKFRECFELLYPLFLHRLREKVPSITRREELLSMLIVLKQDNKQIAELLAIAPRSVLMLRHRFRQKIGMNTEFSLEHFIEDLLA